MESDIGSVRQVIRNGNRTVPFTETSKNSHRHFDIELVVQRRHLPGQNQASRRQNIHSAGIEMGSNETLYLIDSFQCHFWLDVCCIFVYLVNEVEGMR